MSKKRILEREQRVRNLIESALNRVDKDIVKEDTPGLKVSLATAINKPDEVKKLADKADVTITEAAGDLIKFTDKYDLEKALEKQYGKVTQKKDGNKIIYSSPYGELGTWYEEGNYGEMVSGEETIEKESPKSTNTEEPINTEPENTGDTEEQPETGSNNKPLPPQQEQAVFNVEAWSTQLGLDISEPEKTLNNALKFTFTINDSLVTILVLSNGLIKVSSHVISNFTDFKNTIEFHKQI